ncbi:lysophospholipid acyltransferase family protein [Xinfangfangia pollutisoli]|uniref:lysophospholipid acyltransferase family protein n=1 Tax=Xinfangfangia pollutisoli TaxID=2865960 RepID=UPI001CD50E75|nr:lysophospholipid acyltransferase family protein [Xinfangfangia pollutisoli]
MTDMARVQTLGAVAADAAPAAPVAAAPPPPALSDVVFTYSHDGQSRFRRRLIRLIEAASGRNKLERLYRAWRQRPQVVPEQIFTAAMRELGLWPEFTEGSYARVPKEGPLLVVANHPFGIVDGLTIGHLIATVRPDVKLMVHSLLCQPPEAKDALLPVDFGPGPEARRTSAETRRLAVDWLDRGHVLVIFPAGGVATARRPFAKRAADAAWHPFISRLAGRPGVRVLPVFIHGQNSRLFQVVSHYSYPLRVALIFRETTRRMGRAVRIAVGEPLEMDGAAKEGIVARLRAATFALAGGQGPAANDEFVFPRRIRW